MKIVTGRNNPNETPAMTKNTTNKLKYFFRTAHYIVVQCQLISDYISLSKLDKAKSIGIGNSNVFYINFTCNKFRS